jgi:hypothetical protein
VERVAGNTASFAALTVQKKIFFFPSCILNILEFIPEEAKADGGKDWMVVLSTYM